MASRFDNLSATDKLKIQKNIQADKTSLFFAVQLLFDSDTIRIWNGTQDLSLGGQTYTGAGDLLSISSTEDTSELSSAGMTLALSGMNEEIIDLALAENYQNRHVIIHMGFLSGNNEVASSFIFFKGRIMNMSISDGPSTNTISVELENRLIDFSRPTNLRYTRASQQNLFSGDKGLDFVQALQEAVINWGPTTTGRGSGGGSGDGDQPSETRQILQ
jgi:hypothetical protein